MKANRPSKGKHKNSPPKEKKLQVQTVVTPLSIRQRLAATLLGITPNEQVQVSEKQVFHKFARKIAVFSFCYLAVITLSIVMLLAASMHFDRPLNTPAAGVLVSIFSLSTKLVFRIIGGYF